MREEFFACPALALQQHRGLRRGDALNGLLDGFEGGVFADHRRQTVRALHLISPERMGAL